MLFRSVSQSRYNVEYMMFKRSKDCPVHGDYLVEGDDGFIACNVQLNFKIAAKLGYKLVIEKARDINDLSFCGLCMGPDGLMPDFHRCLNKFGWTHDEYMIKQLNSNRYRKKEKELLRAKAMSLLCQSQGTPILQTLALKILDLTSGSKVHKKDFDWWEFETFDVFAIKSRKILMESRLFFEKRFGVSIERQFYIEQSIERVTAPLFQIHC